MKLYIGYEYQHRKHIDLSKGGICFVAYTLKTMQEKINQFGYKDELYSVYWVNITPTYLAEVLDNILSECHPPGKELEVLETHVMSKTEKQASP